MSRSRNRNRKDSIAPTRKRQDETSGVQNEIKNRSKRRKKKTEIQHQQRNEEEDSTQGEYT